MPPRSRRPRAPATRATNRCSSAQPPTRAWRCAEGLTPLLRRALLALATCSGVAPAWAHDAPEEDLSELTSPVDPDSEEIEVVVRGERPPRAASSIVKGRDVLGAAPHGSGSDVLRTVPGVFLSQHGGPGKAHQIFFRGFDAVHGQDLEVWVGGAPVNEISHIHGQGYADLHFLMPEVVQRIEALPGAYDPSQGDFAVAGSMRLTLGYDQPGATLQAGYGAFDSRRLFLAYHPREAPAETFGAFELFESDGFGVGRPSRRASAIGQLLHPIEADLMLRVLVSGYAGHFGSAGVLRQEDVTAGRIGHYDSYNPSQGGRSARTQLVAELVHDDGDSELSIGPYLVLRSWDVHYDYTGFLVDEERGDTTHQHNDATTAGMRGRYRQRIEVFRHDDALEVGVSARSDWIDQGQHRPFSRDLQDGTEVDARLHTATLGGYVDAELHPLRRLLLRGGVRAEAVSLAVEDQTSGARRSAQGSFIGERVVADVVLLPRLHGIASWGRGFRSPQARGVADGAAVPFTTVRSAELGLRWHHLRQHASLAFYRTDLSQDLVFDETRGRNEPVPATERWGAAVHLETTRAGWFTSALGATLTRAVFREDGGRFRAGELVPYVPQIVSRADLAARPRLGTWHGRLVTAHLGLGIQGLFRRPLPYGELGRDAVITDLRLGLSTERLALQLDVRNALDLDWNDGEFVYASRFDREAPSSSLPARHFSAGEPRSWFLSATLHL